MLPRDYPDMDMHLHFRLLLITLLCAGCGSGGATDEGLIVENPYRGTLQGGSSPISFEIDQVFGAEDGPEEALLSQAGYPAVDSAGNAYLLDRNRLVSFDRNGNVRWVHDETGVAPGELHQAFGMAFDGDSALYVTNQTNTRIDVFTTDGVFRESKPVNELGVTRLQGSHFLSDNRLLALSFEGGKIGARLLAIDVTDWSISSDVFVDQTREVEVPEFSTAVPLVETDGGDLVVENLHRYEFVKMTPTLDTLRIIRRDVDDYTPVVIAESRGMSQAFAASRLRCFVRLESGHFLVCATWPASTRDPVEFAKAMMNGQLTASDVIISLDIYAEDWELLYSIEGDELESLELGMPEVSTPDGYLYATQMTPYPRLVRYRIRDRRN